LPVTLGVLRFGELQVWHTHHFTLYDDREGSPLVHVERLEGGSNFRDPEDVLPTPRRSSGSWKRPFVDRAAVELLERVSEEIRGA